MRKLKVGFGLLIAAAMLVGMAGVGWGVPNLINVQGRLVDKATGLAVANQTLDVTVNYYNAETGGTPLLGSGYGYSPTTDSNGVFNIILSGVPDFTAEDYYVEFVVGARIGGTWRVETIPDPTLPSPANKRQRLVAVPFAITAKNVRGGTIQAESSTSGLSAIRASSRSTSGAGNAVEGTSLGLGAAVKGTNTSTSTTGDKSGVEGASDIGIGVLGISAGTATSTYPRLGAGVYGSNIQTTIPAGGIASAGVYGKSASGSGVEGRSGTGNGVKGESITAGKAGVWGENTVASGWGVYGSSTNGIGVYGHKADDDDNDANPAIYGKNDETSTNVNPGVKGESNKGYGVWGISLSGEKAGVFGQVYSGATFSNPAVVGKNERTTAGDNPGVVGYSDRGYGVKGESLTSGKAGVWGEGSGGAVGVYGNTIAAGNIDSPFMIKTFSRDAVAPGGVVAATNLGITKRNVYGVVAMYWGRAYPEEWYLADKTDIGVRYHQAFDGWYVEITNASTATRNIKGMFFYY